MFTQHPVVTVPEVVNIANYRKPIFTKSKFKTSDEYFEYLNDYYIENELKEDSKMLYLGISISLPSCFTLDKQHKCFESFLWKYKKLLADDSMKLCFEYIPETHDTMQFYSIWFMSSIKNIPNRTSIEETSYFWTDTVNELFESEIGCKGKVSFPPMCVLRPKGEVIIHEKIGRMIKADIFITNDANSITPVYNYHKLNPDKKEIWIPRK